MRALSDLKKLRHVVAVARAGSFTAASAALAVTQSSVTKSVAETERLLGIKLFERLPRGVQVTAAGETFVPRAERILNDADELMEDLASLRTLERGKLRIGVAPAAFVTFLESTVSAFARVYPGLSVSVSEGTVADLTQAALNGEVDLVVGGVNYLDREDMFTTQVAKLYSFVIARSDHPLTVKGSPDGAELLKYPVIMPEAGPVADRVLAAAYQAAGLSPVPAQYVCDYFPLVRQLVQATDAISPVVSLAPASLRFRDEFAVFEGVLLLNEQYLGVAHAVRRSPGPAARAFIEIFRSFLRDAA